MTLYFISNMQEANFTTNVGMRQFLVYLKNYNMKCDDPCHGQDDDDAGDVCTIIIIIVVK